MGGWCAVRRSATPRTLGGSPPAVGDGWESEGKSSPRQSLPRGQVGVAVRTFEELQALLGPVLAGHREGSRAEHVVVVLPSLSFGRSVEVYYGARLPTLEHRFLLMVTIQWRLNLLILAKLVR